MLTISIHISLPTSNPHTPETNGILSLEKSTDENPSLLVDKDIPLGSLLTARCCFGTASLNDIMYVVGM